MLKQKGKTLPVWKAIYMVFAEYQTLLVQEIEKATEMNSMQALNLNIHQPIGYYWLPGWNIPITNLRIAVCRRKLQT